MRLFRPKRLIRKAIITVSLGMNYILMYWDGEEVRWIRLTSNYERSAWSEARFVLEYKVDADARWRIRGGRG